jgi:alkylated DNA repair dioxygenase AlkB
MLNLENKYIIKNEEQHLHIEIFENALREDISLDLFQLLKAQAKWRGSFITKSGKLSCKRNKSIYGSISKYIATFRGTTIQTNVYNWEQLPILDDLAKELSLISNDRYNTCVLQYYANEKVGINPHRDKEVKGLDTISSISLGSTRIMRFERNGIIHDIKLTNGSLCIIYPPTNDKWCHSIICEKDKKEPRLSMVFRNHSI